MRFYQDQYIRSLAGAGHRRREHFRSGDKRNIYDHQIDRLANIRAAQFPRIALHANDPRIPLQLPRKLRDVHIHGINPGRVVLQQTIGESTGRATHIEANAAIHGDAEIINRAFELNPTPAGELLRAAIQCDARILSHSGSGGFCALVIYLYFAGKNHGQGLLQGFRQAALHEQGVQPFARCFGFHNCKRAHQKKCRAQNQSLRSA